MKIVHLCVCGEYYEKYAYQDNLLPKYHRKAGHEVTIVAATYSRFDQKSGKVIMDYTPCKFLEDGTKVIRLRPSLPLVINSHVHFFRGLKRVINEEKPDLIFAHGVECPNYLYLSRYKKEHPEVKIVYDNHTDYANSLHSPITRFWAKHVVGEIVVKRLLWTSEKFYGVTPVRSAFLHNVYGVPVEKIDFLPLGADDEEMSYEKKAELRAEVRKKYGVEDDDFLIVTGGKIDRKKNIHTLVEAVTKIDGPKVKILVFGSIVDELKDTFEKLKCDKTIFIGWVPSSDVYQYFYAADLVAFPGLHSVLWEQAVASRVPTAFTRIQGFEHVDVTGNCLFFEQNDNEYYRKEILRISDDKERYAEMVKNADSEKAWQFLYSRIAAKVLVDVKEQ